MKILDLYCGSGGMTQGFVDVFPDAEFVSVEMNPRAVKSHKANFPNAVMYQGKVSDHFDDLLDADLVIGGPPCQGFSKANTQRKGDYGRNKEWQVYMEVCKRSGAKAFVMENVQQLRTKGDGEEWRPLIHEAESQGYKVVATILRACNYGAATVRPRLFTVGIKGEPWQPPQPTHGDPDSIDQYDMFAGALRPWRTVRDAIADLPPPLPKRDRSAPTPMECHFILNTQRILDGLAAIPDGVDNRLKWLLDNNPDLLHPVARNRSPDLFRSCWGVMDWDKPSYTLTSSFINPAGGVYTHPDGKRSITLREGALIQGYHLHHKFFGGQTAIARQIGNSVCPPVARAIAESLRGVFQ